MWGINEDKRGRLSGINLINQWGADVYVSVETNLLVI